MARRRVGDGDNPRVVLREMLTAGVSLWGLRKVMTFAQIGADRSKQDVKIPSDACHHRTPHRTLGFRTKHR